MTHHHWTAEDFDKLREMNRQRIPLAKQAGVIGTSAQSIANRRMKLGISFAKDTCIVCHGSITQLPRGRRRIFCSTKCINLLNSAYAANAYIDGRNYTHCVNCGGRLIPPWTAKRKWCSRACGQRGWYVSSYYGGKKNLHDKRTKRSVARQRAVLNMTQDQLKSLYTLRADGDASDYMVRKLRTMLDIDSKKDLIRYARAIQILA